MKIAIILWTRPEIIKLSSIIRQLQNQSAVEWFIIHTNQHFSKNMDSIFFDELQLHTPKYNLGIHGWSHGEMTWKMLIEIESILKVEAPDVIVVQWDTNSVLAWALAASKLGIKVAHVEAWLRSYDRSMPEEINRILTDHISAYCFAPTKLQEGILLQEGINIKNIYTVGNTIVDAVFECRKIWFETEAELLLKLGIKTDEYILVTMHRPSNVDDYQRLEKLLVELNDLRVISGKKIVFPIHPRTAWNIEKFSFSKYLKNLLVIEPLGFTHMLTLEANAAYIITDSGGIQEEACILEKKVLILRDNTERPETLEVGGACLVWDKVLSDVYEEMSRKLVNWYNPFGGWKTGKEILNLIV